MKCLKYFLYLATFITDRILLSICWGLSCDSLSSLSSFLVWALSKSKMIPTISAVSAWNSKEIHFHSHMSWYIIAVLTLLEYMELVKMSMIRFGLTKWSLNSCGLTRASLANCCLPWSTRWLELSSPPPMPGDSPCCKTHSKKSLEWNKKGSMQRLRKNTGV